MKTYIVNPLGNIPKNPKSHTRGWSMIWSDLFVDATLDEKGDQYDSNSSVMLDFGVNFNGALNLFGGANDDIYNRLNKLMSVKRVVCLEIDMPDLGKMLKTRIGNKTTSEHITEKWCDNLSAFCFAVTTIKQEELHSKNITIGDSHSAAYSNKMDRVFRTNGITLYGSLKRGLDSLLRGVDPESGDVTISLGNIDLRHHICRYDRNTLVDMVLEYSNQIHELEKKYPNANFFPTLPLPVEYEGRKVPKTGYYEGVPFYGSRPDRILALIELKKLMGNRFGDKIITPPLEWYDMDSEEYAKTYMEYGGSVHLGPHSYRRYKGW